VKHIENEILAKMQQEDPEIVASLGPNIRLLIEAIAAVIGENRGGTCEEVGHDYQTQGTGYYRLSGKANPIGPTYDQEVSYATLFCSKCGDRKEIVWQDHRVSCAG